MLTIEFLRSFRIAGYAIFDIVASLVGIYLLAPLLSKLFLKIRIVIPKRSWLLLTLPLGIIVHLIFMRITPMTANFFDLHGHYRLKIVMIVLLVLGLKDIRIAK
jgi:hypothetical protein